MTFILFSHILQVYSKAKGKRAHICPAGPSKARASKKDTFDLGSNDLEQVNSKVTPHAGTLSVSTGEKPFIPILSIRG